MEYRRLTEIEKSDLKSRHKVERDRRVCDRIKAVLMYDDGYSFDEIAKVLLLSREGIRKHLIDYHGDNKLHTENGGNYSKFTSEQENDLIKHLETFNGEYIIEFLKKLEETNRDKSKIYLICDNAGYHKSRKVKEYLQNTRIELIFLPPIAQI